MHPKLLPILLFVLLFLVGLWEPLRAQTSGLLSGQVLQAESQRPRGVRKVYIQGTVSGTSANQEGRFQLKINRLPCTLVIRSVGYQPQEYVITSWEQAVITLAVQPVLADEVVVTASRVAEKSLQSPITIEQMDQWARQQTPAPAFFDALENV